MSQSTPLASGSKPSTPWLAWAATAIFAAGCLWLVSERSKLRTEMATLQERSSLSSVEIATLTSKLDGAPNASAVVVWDGEKQEGLLKFTSMPKPAADKDYQLWVVDPQYEKPVDGGVLAADQPDTTPIQFRATKPVRTAKQFVVSLEQKGGVPEGRGPAVLVSE